MQNVRALTCAILLTASSAVPALSDDFVTVQSRAQFVQIIEGRDLTRFGINVDVSPAGQITGRAFGYPVTGAWQWSGTYFCRDLYWGDDNLGQNCQTVRISGNTIRFISDQGAGDFADLTLR